LLLPGCAKRYVPHLVLSTSAETIDATVEFHSLQVVRSIRSGHESFGVVGEKVTPSSPRELTGEVTAALMREMETNQVFRRLTTFDPKPDLVLSGRIDKFYEHYRPKWWSLVPRVSAFAWLFRLNTYISSGGVDLRMVLLKATGEVVGEYRGHTTFHEDFGPTTEMPPGERLNQAFSQAVQQILDELFADPRLPKVGTASLVCNSGKSVEG
jgi:hypothetical protein